MTCITLCVGFFGFSLGIVASTISVSALLSGFYFSHCLGYSCIVEVTIPMPCLVLTACSQHSREYRHLDDTCMPSTFLQLCLLIVEGPGHRGGDNTSFSPILTSATHRGIVASTIPRPRMHFCTTVQPYAIPGRCTIFA